MKLLAISLPRHDASAAYFDGEDLHYIKLERLKEQKRFAWWDYQTDTVNHYQWKYDIENIFNINIDDVDEIIFDFHMDTVYDNYPDELTKVLSGEYTYCKMPDKHNVLKKCLTNKNIYYISHHYAHALSSWMLHPNPDVSIIIDGEGDERTWSVYKDDTLIEYGEIDNGSIGGSMIDMARELGIQGEINDLAGKLMSLVSYGNIDKLYLNHLQQYTYKDIHHIFSLDKWLRHIGDNLLAKHRLLDWAATVHYYMNQVLIKMFQKYANSNDVISYSGGIAQNIVWNTSLKKEFPNLIIPPHSGDEGLSLGAIELLRRKNNLPKFKFNKFPYIQEDITPNEIVNDKTISQVADYLSQGKIVLWYQENGEIGPRALGNRSILMDPRTAYGKEKINKVKNRENFRPFGASVLKEYMSTISTAQWDDEFMIYTTTLTDNNLSSIKHIDGTCRLQTVDSKNNSTLRRLLEKFYKITNCPCLLNTSLNIAGKPIAGYPEVALTLFNNSNFIDVAVVGNTIHERSN